MLFSDRTFKGSKGGSSNSSSQQKYSQTSDNLRSEDTVEVVLGLCEGPIYGLVNGNQSFYIGDTSVQNASGEYNYQVNVLEVNTVVLLQSLSN